MFTRARTLMLATVVLLGLLVIVGTVWIRFAPGILRSLSAIQKQPPVVGMNNSPLPLPTTAPPTEEIIVITPGPDGVVNLPPATPGQVYAFASPTPFPTRTPRSTPTRRPGPTATPISLRVPASDAIGTVFYVVQEPAQAEDALRKDLVYRFPVGPQAEKLAETVLVSIPHLDTFYNVTPSPDGRYLLLLQPSMPGGTPYIFDMQTTKMWSLAPEGQHESGRFFGWHPDSQRILFWNDREHLLLIDVFTLERTILGFMDGPVQGAAISPDGQKIIYASYLKIGENQSREALWVTSTAGGDAHPLFVFDGASYVFNWSPDDRYVLYMGGPGIDRTVEAQEKAGSRGPLWIVEPDGQNPRPLSGRFISGSGYEPTWSPDSQWVVFTGLDEGQEYGCFPKQKGEAIEWPQCQFVGTGIYVENIQTDEVRRLASGIKPVWSPDGKWVAFLSNQSGEIEIWSVRIDGSELRQITADGLPKSEIVWMPEQEVRK